MAEDKVQYGEVDLYTKLSPINSRALKTSGTFIMMVITTFAPFAQKLASEKINVEEKLMKMR